MNNDNFDEYVGKNNCVIVEFYTKWCQFCKILSPEYNKLAEEYKKKRKDIIIARLDGQDNGFTLQRYGIFRFPFLALFKPNNKQIYSIFHNNRVFDELDKWISEICPEVNEEKEKIKDNNSTNGSLIVNMTEIGNDQNLTTENEYIKNEFIDINKRINDLKYRLNIKSDNNHKKDKNNKLQFEFEISPIFLLISFLVILVLFTIYSWIKNILFTSKEHMK